MRWNATLGIVPALMFGLIVVGCGDPGAQMSTMSDPLLDLSGGGMMTSSFQDSYAAPPIEPPTATFDYPPITPLTAFAPGRTHVVQKGDTLFSLARMYYNNEARWRDIHSANQSLIRNKDLIFVGQKLVIP